MKPHHLLMIAYKELVPVQDRVILDPVRMKIQAELPGCGPAGSVELLYRLGRMLSAAGYRGKKRGARY